MKQYSVNVPLKREQTSLRPQLSKDVESWNNGDK